MAGAVVKRPPLLLPLMVNGAIVWVAASSAGPTDRLVAQLAMFFAPTLSATVWFGPMVKLGGSFTAATSTVNCTVVVALGVPLSTAVSVIWAVPAAPPVRTN